MSIYFSEKFKQLRKARDLTQEEIADIFHVSPQSVSRWENGANYPDVELLPHIAIYFKVTLDELLGKDLIASEEKAKEYIRDIRNLLNSGKLNDAIDLARKALKEYPLNKSLEYHLLQGLCTAEETPEIKNEIIAIGEKILKSTDHNAYSGHKFMLIRQFAKWNMKEEAKKIVYSFTSEAYFTQELTMKYVLEGDELIEELKWRIIRFWTMLHDFIYEYTRETDISVLQKINSAKARKQIGSLIDGIVYKENERNWQEEHMGDAFHNITIARLYCEIGDTENALDCIEIGTQAAMYHIEVMDKTNPDGSNYYPWSTPRNLPWILWEDHLSKPEFDPIRNEERFIKCFELLKSNSRELKHP